MERKNESHDQAQDKLNELYQRIKEFEAKAKDLRAELDEELEGIKNRDSKLYHSLEDLKFSSSAALHDVRQGFEKAAEAIREAIKKASYHFK